MTAPHYEERTRRSWPLAVLAVGALALLGVVHSPVMAVGEVEILGATNADVASAVEGLGVGPGALLLWVNTGAIEEAVAADPWVADVRVDRILPDRLVVEVIEHEPAVWIEGVLSWMLVGRDGTVLRQADDPGSGLMRAELAFPDRPPGDRPSDPLWWEVIEMGLVLSDDIGGRMVLEMRGAEMWTAVFGHEVRLGFPIDLADKGRTLRAMLAEDMPDGAIIDVSSPVRPAVVPRETQATVEPSGGQG